MTSDSQKALVEIPDDVIERRIYLVRDHKVMLDEDLAELYQVETKALDLLQNPFLPYNGVWQEGVLQEVYSTR